MVRVNVGQFSLLEGGNVSFLILLQCLPIESLWGCFGWLARLSLGLACLVFWFLLFRFSVEHSRLFFQLQLLVQCAPVFSKCLFTDVNKMKMFIFQFTLNLYWCCNIDSRNYWNHIIWAAYAKHKINDVCASHKVHLCILIIGYDS